MKGSETLDFLLNETYLYLLQHPQTRLNASQLGAALCKNRKTIASQLVELKEKGLIGEHGEVIAACDIVNFYPEENNKYIRALKILNDLDYIPSSVEEASRWLKVTSKTLTPFYNEVFKEDGTSKEKYEGPAVYQITIRDTDEIIYIGYTTNFELRKRQHLSAILNESSKAELYCYCKEHNIKKVNIMTVIRHTDIGMLKQLETYLIQTLQPVGNIAKKTKENKDGEQNNLCVMGNGEASEAGILSSENIAESQRHQVQLLGF